MRYKMRDARCNTLTDDQYMALLRRVFSSPRGVVAAPLPIARKKHLLKKWYQRRMRYIYECFRDSDYLADQEIDELSRGVRVMSAVLATEAKIDAGIDILERERRE